MAALKEEAASIAATASKEDKTNPEIYLAELFNVYDLKLITAVARFNSLATGHAAAKGLENEVTIDTEAIIFATSTKFNVEQTAFKEETEETIVTVKEEGESVDLSKILPLPLIGDHKLPHSLAVLTSGNNWNTISWCYY